MKKLFGLLALGAFAAAAAAPAIACPMGGMASTKSKPITTALGSQPITPKPAASSGG